MINVSTRFFNLRGPRPQRSESAEQIRAREMIRMTATQHPRSQSTALEKNRNTAQPPPQTAFNPLWGRLALGIQPKLAVSTPDDPYEREADRIADAVMRMPEPGVQRKCAACSAGGATCPDCEDEEARVQRKAEGANGAGEVGSDFASRLGGGTPLDVGSRAFFEPRFGRDFGDVRVHTGPEAAAAAGDIQARAFALGRNIVFGAREYAPGSVPGKHLLAHELTHVVQQSAADVVDRPSNVMQRAPDLAAPEAAAESSETSSSAPEPWVLDIMGDDDLSLMTKLRAVAIGAGWAGPEPKSEDELINNLTDPNNPDNARPNTDQGMSSDEAAKILFTLFLQNWAADEAIRNRAVDKAKALTGADWHAPEGSEARKKADSLHRGNPQDLRDQAMKLGILWVFNRQDAILRVKETALQKYKEKKSQRARETAEAATEVLTAIEASQNTPLESRQYSPGDAEFAENAWRYLGSEKTKKYLEKLGAPIPWFTTCVTMAGPVAEAAGVDLKKWGPLDMFDKRAQKRFNLSDAWVPAEWKVRPQRGDILIMVTYMKDAQGAMPKELRNALFQHLAILVEPVTMNEDGITEKWVTADGGKGSSHRGEDKTGYTTRRYNPAQQQFIPESYTNLQEAAEGGRYLLGFWSLPRLPMRTTAGKE